MLAQNAYAAAGAKATEAFGAIRVVASFGGEHTEIARWVVFGSDAAGVACPVVRCVRMMCAAFVCPPIPPPLPRATATISDPHPCPLPCPRTTAAGHSYKRHLFEAERNGIKKGMAAGLVMASFFALMFVMCGVGLYFGLHLVLQFRHDCSHHHSFIRCIDLQMHKCTLRCCSRCGL